MKIDGDQDPGVQEIGEHEAGSVFHGSGILDEIHLKAVKTLDWVECYADTELKARNMALGWRK